VRFDERRYRWLLRLLPASFRDEHERELMRVWRDESRDAAGPGSGRVWRSALTDTLRVAPREHASAWARDVRYAMRGLAKSPAFAITATVTLALGTGAAGAVFSLFNTVILRPMPWRAPERVGLVWAVPPGSDRTWLSFPELDELQRDIAGFSSVAGLTDVRFAFSDAGRAEEVQGLAVSHALFSTLGVRPRLGRDFSADDDREGAAPVAILGDAFWRSSFGADPSVVGRRIDLDGRSATVIGVLPDGFEILPATSVLPDRVDMYVPLEPHLASRDRSVRFLHGLARLRDGVSFTEANQQLASYASGVQRQFPALYSAGVWSFSVRGFQDEVLASARMALGVMSGLVALVLVMACANVANLLLARGETRRSEIAVKAALGAAPGRLAGELMAEALLLAAGGCALGLAGAALLPQLIRSIDPGALPRLAGIGVDWCVIAFMAGLLAVTAVVFALAPMAERLRVRTATVMATRSGGRSARAARVSAALVVVQTVLATVVVVTTLFLIRTFAELQRVDLGFAPANVLTARLTRMPQQVTADDIAGFYDRALASVSAMPDVTASGAITQLPLSGATLGSTFLAGPQADARRIDADLRGVTPGYFDAIGTRLVAGRFFDSHDLRTTHPVAIVDEAFAQKLSADGRVIGRLVRWFRQADVEIEIVGVVRSLHHRGVSEPVVETVYRPHTQYTRLSMFIAVRTRSDPARHAAAVTAAIRAIDLRQPLADVATMEERVARSMTRARTNLLLAGMLAALGLVLAGIGLYGVLSFGVSQRLREFGVRLTLGATPAAVGRGVLLEGLRLTGIGVGVGVLAATAMVRAVSAVLYGTNAADIRQYALAAGVVIASSAVAFWLPALRAAAADPVTVLRSD